MKVWIQTAPGESESVAVRALEGDLFQLLETPFLTYPDSALGDIVRLHELGEELYEIQEVIDRPYKHHDFLIPGTYGASKSLYDFGDWVRSRGAEWECLMLGILIIHLPDGDAIEEMETELQARLRRFDGSDEEKRLLAEGPPKVTRDDPESGRGEIRIDALHKKEEPPR